MQLLARVSSLPDELDTHFHRCVSISNINTNVQLQIVTRTDVKKSSGSLQLHHLFTRRRSYWQLVYVTAVSRTFQPAKPPSIGMIAYCTALTNKSSKKNDKIKHKKGWTLRMSKTQKWIHNTHGKATCSELKQEVIFHCLSHRLRRSCTQGKLVWVWKNGASKINPVGNTHFEWIH